MIPPCANIEFYRAVHVTSKFSLFLATSFRNSKGSSKDFFLKYNHSIITFEPLQMFHFDMFQLLVEQRSTCYMGLDAQGQSR